MCWVWFFFNADRNLPSSPGTARSHPDRSCYSNLNHIFGDGQKVGYAPSLAFDCIWNGRKRPRIILNIKRKVSNLILVTLCSVQLMWCSYFLNLLLLCLLHIRSIIKHVCIRVPPLRTRDVSLFQYAVGIKFPPDNSHPVDYISSIRVASISKIRDVNSTHKKRDTCTIIKPGLNV